MRIIIHSGTAHGVVQAVQNALHAASNPLLAEGVLFPSEVVKNGDSITRAALPLSELHPLAALNGLADPVDHQFLLARVRGGLSQAVSRHRPRVMILSLPEAAIWLDSPLLLSGLAGLLSNYSDDLRPVLHAAHPSTALTDLYLTQVAAGRSTGLESEGQIARDKKDWWEAATSLRENLQDPARSPQDARLLAPMPVVDSRGTAELWAQVFGADTLTMRELPFGPVSSTTLAEIAADLELPVSLPIEVPEVRRPSVPVLCRMLTVNAALSGLENEVGPIPGALRSEILERCYDDLGPLQPVELAPLTAHLRPLDGGGPVPVIRPMSDFDPRPLLEDLPPALATWHSERLEGRSLAQSGTAAMAENGQSKPEPLSPAAEILLDQPARDALSGFAGTAFWPHNRVVKLDEAAEMPPFPDEPGELTNSLIIACMKNEGPYIIEWVAYHRAIGIDHFLIFTNDCSDGTNEILDRLAELGYVTREDNEDWKGKSPQQNALNKAMRMDVVKQADWLIHIDVDEYINIRIGQGTMAELISAMGPDATNLAMTWRLFGNGGVDDIGDGSVISRFTGCSPAYCPKPHTIWGFKSMTRNNGAYGKLSCHRPNKWDQTTPVKWLNGSLTDTTRKFRDKGWRNSISSVGFDAVQLNHYALRSRESFLIKRQRGRALHVDRSIGLNYWVRHDWNQNEDRTILRQIPRMEAVKRILLADPELARLQEQTLAWHRARATELRNSEAFDELWNQTTQADLTDPERVAYATAAGMES
ncbi:glycosyltransferase family 2 protein [Paracoccus aerodenitrificans]|uniref:glycosyltransferase family 2 protein n=1 Tax=Paracoccus aerodenitrificans TaxID=3017781 RepID=UPI0022F0E924|nr:glycosyltransferase family 2 protein [Paracoccus aerodenitrificans]WBU63535.1 glycosyltransferase family 2 protein [Paracoccus aerodenitrificans]